MPVRVEWWPIQARSIDGGTIEVLVPEAYLEKMFESGPCRKYHDAELIPDVLRTPNVILEGLERAEFDHAFRYYGSPTYRWNGESEEPPPENKVFAVHVTYSEEREAFVVLDWEWVPEHGEKAGFPFCFKEGS